MCHKPTYAVQQAVPLLDDLVGAREQHGRDGKTQRLGGGQVDNEIELGRLLHWNVARLRPPQYFIDIVGGVPEQVWKAWSIGHQTSRFDELADDVNRGVGRPPAPVWPPCPRRPPSPSPVLHRAKAGQDLLLAPRHIDPLGPS
jgi:hypothetical protein